MHGESPSPAAPPPWLDPAVLAATCGWLGRIPFAPGTFGAAAGLVVSLALARSGLPLAAEVAAIVALNVVGIPLCTAAARRLGRGSDPGAIVYDEMAAMALTLLVVPPAHRTPPVVAAAFLLFRLFDVTKPPPARWCERLPAGLGIMADDWAAAAWAAAALAAIRALGWS